MGNTMKFITAIVLACATEARLGNHVRRLQSAPSTMIITEIMYNPSSCSDTTGEWIELFNNGNSDIDLSGWSIKDKQSSAVPLSSVTVAPGDYYIAGRTTNGCGGLNADSTFGFALNNGGGGDKVSLLDASDNVVDEHSYKGGDAGADKTVERQVDGEGRPTETWVERSANGGSPRAGYTAPEGSAAVDIKITEIMFNPDGCSDSVGEWIELYNAGTSTVDLSGWTLEDNSGSVALSSTLAPGAYYIAARTVDGCGGLNADVTFSLSLSNSGDVVELRDDTSALHDSHSYGSSAASAGYSTQLASDGTWEQGPLGGSPRSGYGNGPTPTAPVAAPVSPPTSSPTSLPTSLPTANPTANPTPLPTSSPTATLATVDIKITEIMFNPDACSDSSGEWIELYNAGSSAVDLSGWTLQDNAGSVSLSSILAPGDYYIAARTIDGCGGLNADVTFSFSLSNSGDVVELRDATSALHDSYSYSSSAASAGYSTQLTSSGTWEQGPLGGSPRSGYGGATPTAPVAAPVANPTPVAPVAPVASPPTATKAYLSFSLELVCGSAAGYATRFTYELVGPDLGNEARSSSFHYDSTLPQSCQQTSRSSYSHPNCGSSGRKTNPYCFDRGHLVMANHMDNDAADIYESNYMTNILPQAAGFNQHGGAWLETEEIIECGRDISNVQKQVIFGGALFTDSANDYFLSSHGIPTPETFWKVIVRHFNTGDAPDVIAWLMPNDYTSTDDLLDTYLRSVAQIQALTGDAMLELPASYTETAYAAGTSWTKPSGCDLSRR